MVRRGSGKSAMMLSKMNERRLTKEEAEQVADRWRESLRRGSIGAMFEVKGEEGRRDAEKRAEKAKRVRRRQEREARSKMRLSDKYIAVRLLLYLISPWTEGNGWWVDRSRINSSYPDLEGRGAKSVVSGGKVKQPHPCLGFGISGGKMQQISPGGGFGVCSLSFWGFAGKTRDNQTPHPVPC